MLDRSRDYTTKDGAEFLARQITQFWAARGKRPRVEVVPYIVNRTGELHYKVRSNMAGGQP
jgi:hypothetical protein